MNKTSDQGSSPPYKGCFENKFWLFSEFVELITFINICWEVNFAELHWVWLKTSNLNKNKKYFKCICHKLQCKLMSMNHCDNLYNRNIIEASERQCEVSINRNLIEFFALITILAVTFYLLINIYLKFFYNQRSCAIKIKNESWRSSLDWRCK